MIIGSSSEAGRVRTAYQAPRIGQIFNPVDTDAWRPDGRAETRATLAIPPAAHVCVWHGRIAIEKKGLDRFKARVYFACAAAVFPWGRHVRAALPLFRRGLETALQTGDQTYTAYAYGHLVWNRLTSADPIEEVQREADAVVVAIPAARATN